MERCVLNRNLTRVCACQLWRYQPPVDLRLHATHPFCFFVPESKADTALAIAYADNPGRMMHAVDDHVARLSHRAAGYYGNAVQLFPAQGLARLYQRLVRCRQASSQGWPDVDPQQQAASALRLGDSLRQKSSDSRVDHIRVAGQMLRERPVEPRRSRRPGYDHGRACKNVGRVGDVRPEATDFQLVSR